MTAKANHVARVILCLFWIALGLSASLAQAEMFRYKYISLNQLKLPPGYESFFPVKILDNGRVYGTAFPKYVDDLSYYSKASVAVLDHGVVSLLGRGMTWAANEEGIVGGGTYTSLDDNDNPRFQATLYRGHTKKVIPYLPGAIDSQVIGLTNDATALVRSYDTEYYRTYYLLKKGRSTLLDFDLTASDSIQSNLVINNEETIAGAAYIRSEYYTRGFRYNPSTGKTVRLNPLPMYQDSYAMDINNKGNVLGYSFNIDGGGEQRIGLWDKKGVFHTYFVEGKSRPEFRTMGTRLVFNDKNLIVSTATYDYNSYLVPKPGVRLNLADLVVNLPAKVTLSAIYDINNEGDMIGHDFISNSYFLLKRVDAKTPIPVARP